MTRGLAVYFLAAGVLAAPKFAHSQELPPGTMACLARLQQKQTAVVAEQDGSPRLGDVCPDVAGALAAGPWAVALPEGELRDLTAASLRRLVDLARHYRRAPAGSRALSPAKLGRIVAGLEPFEPTRELSLWDRMIAKLREWLGLDRGDGAGLAKWLRHLSIPPAWRRVLVYALGLSLVAGAVAVLLNELRHGGAFTRGSRRRRASPAGPAAASASRPSFASLDDVLSAPPGRQPVLLFALLVERLRSRHAGLVRESVTHRELVAAARRQGLAFAASLGAVAAAAEDVTFGDRMPDGAQLESVLTEGKTVLRELDDEPEPAL